LTVWPAVDPAHRARQSLRLVALPMLVRASNTLFLGNPMGWPAAAKSSTPPPLPGDGRRGVEQEKRLGRLFGARGARCRAGLNDRPGSIEAGSGLLAGARDALLAS